MVLEWTLSKRLGLANSNIDPSLLQRQSASQEKHGRLHIFLHQYLRTRGQEAFYKTCAACALSAVTSEESLRDSQPPLNAMDTRAPRDRRLHEV